MEYSKREPIEPGCIIWINEGSWVGKISSIISTEDDMQKWGVEEPGIMVTFDLSGTTNRAHAFLPERLFLSEGVELLRHEEICFISDMYRRLMLQCPELHTYTSFNIYTVTEHLGGLPSISRHWGIAVYNPNREDERKHFLFDERKCSFIPDQQSL